MEAQAGVRPLPIGRSGLLDALPLAADGDHALLFREAGQARVLLTADSSPSHERLVVMPLSTDDVEVRVDGDALAVWLAAAPLTARRAERVPIWASSIGLVLLLAILAFAVIGSAVVFGWLLEALR